MEANGTGWGVSVFLCNMTMRSVIDTGLFQRHMDVAAQKFGYQSRILCLQHATSAYRVIDTLSYLITTEGLVAVRNVRLSQC